MLKGIGFKNERLLTFSIDLVIVSLVALVAFLILGFPHFFPYFKELEKVATEMDPAKYMEVTQEIHNRFEKALLEASMLYWLYESFALILKGQTAGMKVFGKKLVFQYEGPCKKLLWFMMIPARTLIKVLSIYWMIPVFIIGIQFLFSKTNKTLLDRIFLTQIEGEK